MSPNTHRFIQPMDKDNNNSDSLEDSTSSVIATDSLESSLDTVRLAPDQQSSEQKPKKTVKGTLKQFSHRFNIYLLLFALLLMVGVGIAVITALAQDTTKDPTITSQSVPSDALKQLSKSDTTVGDPKQVLNVQSNAVFAGKVLIRDNLDVAGTIHVNGSLSLPGIVVSGDSTFDQVQINKTLNIGGDTSVLGQLNVKKNISVTGGGTFGGPLTAPQLTTNQLQLLGDLNLVSHIVAGGATPGRSNGSALGSGGTASVSGADSAGSININTGNGSAVGCFITVNFVRKYNNTPHVVITPTNSSAANLNYYVNRTTTGFSVCTASTPGSDIYSFDYIVVG